MSTSLFWKIVRFLYWVLACSQINEAFLKVLLAYLRSIPNCSICKVVGKAHRQGYLGFKEVPPHTLFGPIFSVLNSRLMFWNQPLSILVNPCLETTFHGSSESMGSTKRGVRVLPLTEQTNTIWKTLSVEAMIMDEHWSRQQKPCTSDRSCYRCSTFSVACKITYTNFTSCKHKFSSSSNWVSQIASTNLPDPTIGSRRFL
jgi:hypothetical protein